MTSVQNQLARMTAAEQGELDSHIAVLAKSKNRAGNNLSAGTLVGYINKLRQIYADLKEEMFDPYEFDIWVIDKGYAPGTVIQYIDVVCKIAQAKCADTADDLQAMRELYCGLYNHKENYDKQWRFKDVMMRKFAHMSYHELLRKVLKQAESELAESTYPKAQDNRIRIILICLMLTANAPMRGDYRNIVIKDRMETVPEKTPYYHDGWVYTPPGSRLKDSDGRKDSPEKIDMRGAQELIETCIASHESQYLLGIAYNSSSFSRLLREQTKRTTGVETGLGIRFFRTKYSIENDAVTEKAHKILSVMGHTGKTHRRDYTGAARNEAGGPSYCPTGPDYRAETRPSFAGYGPAGPDYGTHDTTAGFPTSVERNSTSCGYGPVWPDYTATKTTMEMAEEDVIEAVKNGNFGGLVDYDDSE